MRSLSPILLLFVLWPAAGRADSRSVFRVASVGYDQARTQMHLRLVWQNPGFSGRTAAGNTVTFVLFKGKLPSNHSDTLAAGEQGGCRLGTCVMGVEAGEVDLVTPLTTLREHGIAPGDRGLNLGGAWGFGHTWGDAGKEVPLDLPP